MGTGDDKAGPTEAEVLAAIRAGRSEEYRHLVRACQQDIYAMIMRQVGDAEIACDLTQEVFVRAYNGIAKFRGNAAFKTWVTRIALNAVSSYFCSRRFKERACTKSLSGEEPAAANGELRDELEIERQIGRLRAGIALLKPIYRDVVVLCGLEKKTYTEAAVLLGIPVGTVCSRMNKAFALLRRRFEED